LNHRGRRWGEKRDRERERVKQSSNRPGVAQKVPGGLGSKFLKSIFSLLPRFFFLLMFMTKTRLTNEAVGLIWQENVDGKAIRIQAWTDPEGSRRVRLPGFMTFGT